MDLGYLTVSLSFNKNTQPQLSIKSILRVWGRLFIHFELIAAPFIDPHDVDEEFKLDNVPLSSAGCQTDFQWIYPGSDKKDKNQIPGNYLNKEM